MRPTGPLIVAAVATFGCTPPTDQIDCQAALGRLEISTVLEKDKEVRIREFFKSLAADGYSARHRELIADIASVGSPNLDDSTPSPFIVSELPALPDMSTVFPTERFLDVRRLIANGRLDELAALAGDIPSLVRGQVVGQSVAALLVQQPPDVLGASMDRLIEAGFEFGLHELAAAIASDVPLATFELLLANSDANLAESWTDRSRNRPMDLAGFAASKSRLHLLEALLERRPNPAGSRAMDYLAEPSNDGEVAAAESAVKRLAAAGYGPLLPGTVGRIGAWMPEETLVSLNFRAAVPDLTQDVRNIGARFQDEIGRLDGQISDAREQEAQCLADDTGQSSNTGSLLAKRRISGEVSIGAALDPSAMVEAFRMQTTTDLEYNLGQMWAVMNPALAGRWEDFQHIVDRLEDTDPNLAFATRLALFLAPYDVVTKTVARSGKLPEDAAIRVVSRTTGDAIEVLGGLSQYNVDLHFTDPSGLNAVGAASRTMMFPETLDYLIDQGVAVKPNVPGYDALDYVLLKLVTQPGFRTSRSALPWIRTLIDHGAPVEASHLQSMEMLRLDRPVTYADIVEEVPELATST